MAGGYRTQRSWLRFALRAAKNGEIRVVAPRFRQTYTRRFCVRQPPFDDFAPKRVASALAGEGGGGSSSMLRVTLWEVRAEKNIGQSSLSKSGETQESTQCWNFAPPFVRRRSDAFANFRHQAIDRLLELRRPRLGCHDEWEALHVQRLLDEEVDRLRQRQSAIRIDGLRPRSDARIERRAYSSETLSLDCGIICGEVSCGHYAGGLSCVKTTHLLS